MCSKCVEHQAGTIGDQELYDYLMVTYGDDAWGPGHDVYAMEAIYQAMEARTIDRQNFIFSTNPDGTPTD